MSGCPKVRVGHLPDPYQLDVVYAGETPIGEVQSMEVQSQDPDHLRPFIEKLLGDWSAALSRISRGLGRNRISGC